MKIIEKKVNINATAPAGYVFIDIETTGLAKESTNIYLVGLTHYVCDANVSDARGYWLFKQWLLESPMEEAEALCEIAEYLKNFDTLVHFNGDRFDLPYLDYHARLAGVSSPYLTMKSLDIFKKIRSCKSLFTLDSAKQKSFERIVGNDRKDMYGGGELVEVYYEYLASLKCGGRDSAGSGDGDISGDEELLRVLFLHNEEDVLGMTTLINLLPYGRLYEAGHKITTEPPKVIKGDDDKLLLQFTTNDFFKYKITRRFEGYYLILEGDKLNIKIPLTTCEMKYFFPHPEDYYYLPKEDMAVHKSVGAAVDPNYREKANKENCYAKKSGSFIKLFSTDYARIYKCNYWALPHTLVDDALLADVDFWNHFLMELFREIKKDCYLE